MKELITEADLQKLKGLDGEKQTEFISRMGLGAKRQVLKLIARREKIPKILEIIEAYKVKKAAAKGKDLIKVQKEINIFIKYLQKYKKLEK